MDAAGTIALNANLASCRKHLGSAPGPARARVVEAIITQVRQHPDRRLSPSEGELPTLTVREWARGVALRVDSCLLRLPDHDRGWDTLRAQLAAGV